MHTISKNHRRSFICFALLGLFGGIALPSVGNATTPGISEAAPTPATDDDDCPPETSAVLLEIDVTTGYAYVVDAAGVLTPLVNNELDVYVGTLGRVLVDLQFSSGEWAVDVSASGGSTTTHLTRGGALRYWMNTTPDEYLFSATSLSAMTMMNMTPIEPDIVIRPTKDCPPPT